MSGSVDSNRCRCWATRDQGHGQAHTGAQRFATVSRLNDMFLLFGGCVRNVSPISSNMNINHVVLKRQLAQWVQVKSFTNLYAAAPYMKQLKILEDMFVIRVL